MATQDSKNDKNKDISDNYSFTILREEATDIDSFEDKTHEKIAETLYQIIKKETKGLTIGLEGTWGSGKSVVVSILKRKIKDEKNVFFFPFDAWAHEGDPLRRIFLESLIDGLKDKLKSKGKILEELQAKISKRIKNCNIKTTRTATWLGTLLAIAVIMVPIGIGLFRKVDLERLTYEWTERPYVLLWLAIIGMIAPFIVLFCNIIRLLSPETRSYIDNGQKKQRKLWDIKNWSFIQSNSTENITQEISEDEERSSIEFEKYFEEIMKELFGGEPDGKLVMVIDNLDRIDVQDSLKLWSTLQTFLQQRSTPSNKNNWFEKIWVLVPYDPIGLSKIWDKNEEKKDTSKDSDEEGKEKRKEKGKENLSSQFFDKCFQLKLEVPKPILTAWELFAKNKIDEAFVKWDSDERKKVLDILKLTRKTLTDTPTPRQVKNYINQVGLLRMHSIKEIPTESIAYYVVQRILEKNTIDEIREKLLSGELPEQLSRQFLPEFCSRDMAGLVFGVSPNKGQQLLLEDDIEQALSSGDAEKLKELREKHSNGFWTVFSYHIQKQRIFFDNLLRYSKAIYIGLWETPCEELYRFRKIAIRITSNHNAVKWPSKYNIEYYSCLLNILSDSGISNGLYTYLMQALNEQIKADDKSEGKFDIADTLGTLQEFVKIFKIDTKFKLPALTIDKFMQWAHASVKLNIPAWKWIVPNDSLSDQMKGKIVPGSILPPGLSEAFIYLVKANVSENWSGLVTACQNHIQFNRGEFTGSSHSKEIFEILFILAFKLDKYDNEIKSIVENWAFCNLAGHFYTNETPSPQIALLCAKYRNQLHTHQQFPRSLGFANKINIYWKNHNEDNAKIILDLLNEHKKWDFLWDLAEDPTNKLVTDIILLSLKDDGVKGLFETNNGLRKIKICSGLFDQDKDESLDLLVKALITYSHLEDEIIQSTDVNVKESSRELYYIVDASSNRQLIAYLAEKVKSQSKEIWSEALRNDTYLTSLAIALKEKDSSFDLDNDYADAFIDFAKDISKGIAKLTDWQKDFWQKLVSLMGNSFQIQYKSDLTEFVMDEHDKVSNEFIEFSGEYFDYDKILQKADTVQNMLRDALSNKNIAKLNWLNELVLSSSVGKKFKPQSHFPELVRKQFNELLKQEQGNKDNTKLIEELASKFHVKLIDAVREEENDGLVKTIVNNKWRLFFNPAKGAGASKIMRFDKGGIILEGKNDNESTWRIQNDHLELVDSDGKVHGRFKYDSKNSRFNHTNDPDTGAILKHSIRDQYLVVEVN
jgi:hypothetical protein